MLLCLVTIVKLLIALLLQSSRISGDVSVLLSTHTLGHVVACSSS